MTGGWSFGHRIFSTKRENGLQLPLNIPIFPSVTLLSLLLSSSSWSSLAGHCWARRSWPRRVAWFSAQFSNTWETCPPGHPLHSTYNLDFTTWSMKISKHKTSYLKHTTKNMFGSVFLGTTSNCSCVSAFHPLSLKLQNLSLNCKQVCKQCHKSYIKTLQERKHLFIFIWYVQYTI